MRAAPHSVTLAALAVLAGALPAWAARADESPAARADDGAQDPASAPSHGGPEEPASPPPARPGAGVPAAAHRNRWFALPVVFYLPETKLGFGATSGVHLAVKDAPQPASIFAAAVYTLEKQGTLDLAGDVTLPGGTYVSARSRAVIFPDEYFGLGPRTPSSALEKFTRRSIELVTTVEQPIPRAYGLRAGVRLDLRAEEIRDRQAGGALAAGSVSGANGFSAVAAGPSFTWDTRDNPFWTRSGTLAQLWYVFAPGGLGRHEPFGRGVLEVRHFFPLGGARALGVDAYAEQADGHTPFTLLPKLGSTRFMRGIREGRYRDRVDWALQTEARTPVWRRLSAAAFVAVGDVAPRWSAFTLGSAKVAGGAGLRYRLTDEGANLRVDVAESRFGPQLYVLVLEAF
jgi:hypothetical protein